MSVLRKSPFIELSLSRLTEEQLGLLLAALNSNSAPDRYTLKTIPTLTEGDIIAPVVLELETSKPAYNGYLIHVTDKNSLPLTLFIGYHRFQDLMLISIDAAHHNYIRVNEYCDINELRRVINELGGSQTGGLTPAGLLGLIEAGEGVVVDLSEDESKVEVHLDQDVLDSISLKEITNATVSGGVITVPTGYIEEGKFYKFIVEIETSGTHTSASFDLCPYNDSLAFAIAYINVGGDTNVEIHGAIQDDGTVTFQVIGTELASSDVVLIHYLRYL